MADPSGRDDQTYEIIGAAMAVHRELGCGFLERVYQETLAIERSSRGIGFKREVKFAIEYKGQLLPLTYLVDFLCYENIVVELKAVAGIGPIERAQTINDLRMSGHKRRLILNFGARSLQWCRLIWDEGPRWRHETGFAETVSPEETRIKQAPSGSSQPLIKKRA